MLKGINILGLVCYLSGAVALGASQEGYPPRLTRSESFLGVHFDFHASDDCKQIGQGVDREMVEYIIDQVKPDYVQCDCKGHPGLSSYPTKVGNPAPGFVKDPLKIWREVTAERGVALYMHYSGVWDSKAVQTHPEWARINEKGEKDDRLNSVYGPYVDNLLIPQLKELSDEYGVDGVWVDGECWATERDYSDRVIEAFQKQTGAQEAPRKPEDPHWFEFSEFCRDGFRRYLSHYVTELHNHNRKFQIASNWAYSSMMPEPAASIADCGKGKIAATYLNLGERYRNADTAVSRDFLQALVRELLGEPLVTVSGSRYVDVTVNRKDGRLAVNLVNTAGPHANGKVYVFDDVPAVGPLSVAIRYGKKPNKVMLEPYGRKLDYTYLQGRIRLTVPRLAIHDIIVVE